MHHFYSDLVSITSAAAVFLYDSQNFSTWPSLLALTWLASALKGTLRHYRNMTVVIAGLTQRPDMQCLSMSVRPCDVRPVVISRKPSKIDP